MLETIRTVLLLLPAVVRAVKEIEALFPESGQGAMKLALIREALTDVADHSETLWPLIEKLISAVVRIFNELGIFRN